jgi:hypothetical protein
MADVADRIRLYETELSRLDVLDADLARLWTQMPRYGYLAVLAPVVWYFTSWGWAVTYALVVAALVGTQAYLIGVRRNELAWTRKQVAEDLGKLRSETALKTG